MVSCTHVAIVYRPSGGNAVGWTPRWFCNDCGLEFGSLPTEFIEVSREALWNIERLSRLEEANTELKEKIAKFKAVLSDEAVIERATINWVGGQAWKEGEGAIRRFIASLSTILEIK